MNISSGKSVPIVIVHCTLYVSCEIGKLNRRTYRALTEWANSQLYSPKIGEAGLIQDKRRGNHLRCDDLLIESSTK